MDTTTKKKIDKIVIAIAIAIILFVGFIFYYFTKTQTTNPYEENEIYGLLTKRIFELSEYTQNLKKQGKTIKKDLEDSIISVTNNKNNIINLDKTQITHLLYRVDTLTKSLTKVGAVTILITPNSTTTADSLQLALNDLNNLQTKYTDLQQDYKILKNTTDGDLQKLLDTIKFYKGETNRLKRKLIVKNFNVIYLPIGKRRPVIRKEVFTINTKKLKNISVDFSVAHGETNYYQNKSINIKIRFEAIKDSGNGSQDFPILIKEQSIQKTYIATKTKINCSFLELKGDDNPKNDKIKDLTRLKRIVILIEGIEVYQFVLPPHDGIDEED